MPSAHLSHDTIVKWAGAWNSDILLGWETGLKGKERKHGKLFDRSPPGHLMEPHNSTRLSNWYKGFEASKRYLTQFELKKWVVFTGNDGSDKAVSVTRSGWSAKRGTVVTQLEKAGCFGEVSVDYYEGSKLKRTVSCGI